MKLHRKEMWTEPDETGIHVFQQDGKDNIRLGLTDSRTNTLLVFTLWRCNRISQGRERKQPVSIVAFVASAWRKARNKGARGHM